jgi:Uma2 family endonuclease
MTVVASQALLTAEEFAKLPAADDGSQQELVRGLVVTMPPPGARHGACCSKIDRRIGTYVETHNLGTVFSNDTGFIAQRDPDTVRGPDIAFWARQRLPEVPEGYVEIPPDLAVEVVSPSDHFSTVQTKVRQYLDHGVKLVWVVDPEDRSVTVYRALDKVAILTESDTITGDDVLPGFSIPVRDFF